jgi:hypothetical protein
VASVRPGWNGTVASKPASQAAFSTAAEPASTIRSASEICAPPPELNSRWMPSRVLRTVASCSGWLTSQLRCGSRRIRVPLAPPRWSVERWLAAEAQAVETSWAIVRPDSRILPLRAATSASPTSSWSTAGTGSCHSWGSGTHGPRKRLTGPMSRCSSLYQALAKARANSSGCSRKRREIFSYVGPKRSARSVVSIVGRYFFDGSYGSGMISGVFGDVLLRTCRARGELPLEAEEDLEELVAPLRRPVRPSRVHNLTVIGQSGLMSCCGE